MTFYEIKKSSRTYYPAIAVNVLLPRSFRLGFLFFFGLILFLLLVPTLFYFLPTLLENPLLAGLVEFERLFEITAGFFFLVLPIFFVVFGLHIFFNSYYYRGFESTLKEKRCPADLPISFETAVFSYYADEKDMTISFINLVYGEKLLLRAGLSPVDIVSFVSSRKRAVPSEVLNIKAGASDGKIRLSDIAVSLYRSDKEFSSFLFSKKIQEQDFLESARWLSAGVSRQKRMSRWWGRDSLGRIPGFGKDWAYGGTWKLKKYAIELNMMLLPSIENRPSQIRNDVDRLEAVLAKAHEANAIIVGEDGGNKKDVLLGFVSRIQEGRIFPQLENRKVFELDTNRLVSENGTKADFEKEFIGILDESVKAGNVILAIPDLASFVHGVSQMGSNVSGILDPFLASSEIHVIALCDPEAFHKIVEPSGILMERFDVLMIKDGGVGETLEALEEEAEKLEARYGMIFSVPVLSAVAESAERYIAEGVMPDKAIDLLYEVAGQMNRIRRKYVGIEDVLVFVKERTGIPAGEPSSQEREKLMNLEKILHRRVVGQDEAVEVVANAMKRSRAGLANPKRPMGSFLFLGPTGVGKTETTKALAEAFFGGDDKILRLDMSEYNGSDSLAKLIGSFDSNSPGVLSSMLRENPYGVLLLDEFEKADRRVMDLFLQVLDEGFFSDMVGRKINARNLIIIATSNAGSDIIYDAVSQGENLLARKSEIIDTIIKQGDYRPELLNRFDGVVLFHPIETSHQKEIAKLMLDRLAKRLSAKGYELVVNDALLDYLVKFGSDPKFGARPMNRAIQDRIEQRIADKIIRKELVSGQKIEFSADDLDNIQ